ncbi:Egg cell-secreted protein 1.1 [Melia azedarach]|uniref:Egg cell-secreted protein 1.1 n=1 Tax=Melia azedarach TaxID=155640 RepID=A0ACC1XVL7_MELAZ|nr:Egg cell-secreted protein 1.1 [Melia azedarach]
MMALKNVFLLLVLTCSFMAYAAARNINNPTAKPAAHENVAAAAAVRLNDEEEDPAPAASCSDYAEKLEPCKDRFHKLFDTGKDNTDLECCQSLDNVSSECWFPTLDSLDLTVVEGTIVKAFCKFDTDL